MKKNLISLLLAVLMIASVFPALAAETPLFYIEENFDGVSEDCSDLSSAFKLTNGWGYVIDENSFKIVDGQLKVTKRAEEKQAQGPAISYTLPETLDGVVEVGVTLRVDEISNSSKAYSSQFFNVAGPDSAGASKVAGFITLNPQNTMFLGGNTLCVDGGDTNYFAVVGNNPKGKDLDDRQPHDVKLVFDFNNGTYTAYGDGQIARKTKGTAWNNIDGLFGDCYRFIGNDVKGLKTVNFNCNYSYPDSECVLYIDNFYVRQTAKKAPKLVSSTVESGEEGVSVADGISVSFDSEMNIDTLSEIVLYEGEGTDGNIVSTQGVVSSEKDYSLVPTEPLNYVTKYTLSIPNTVKSAEGGIFAGQTITFTTQYPSNEYYVSADFNGVTKLTPLETTEYMEEVFGGTFLWQHGMRYIRGNDGEAILDGNGQQIPKVHYLVPEDEAMLIDRGAIDDTNIVKIENGKLILARRKRTSTHSVGSQYRLTLPRIGEGKVRVGFDYILPGAFKTGMWVPALFAITDTVEGATDPMLTGGAGVYAATVGGKPQWRAGTPNNANQMTYDKTVTYASAATELLTAGNHRVEIEIDFTQTPHMATIDIDNGAWTAAIEYKAEAFSEIRVFTCDAPNGVNIESENRTEIQLDNLSVRQVISPTVSSSVTDGETAADPQEPVILTFNTPIRKSSAANICMYENGNEISSPMFDLSDDGMTMTIRENMKYSMLYEIKIFDDCIADNGLSLAPTTISFHTMHKPFDVRIGTSSVTDENGLAVTTLAGQERLTVAVDYTNTADAERDVMVVAAIYRGGMMEDIVMEKHTVAAHTSDTLDGPTLLLPENQAGLTASIYVWDGYKTMNSLLAVRTITAAE